MTSQDDADINAWKWACWQAYWLEHRLTRLATHRGRPNLHLMKTRRRIEGLYTLAISRYPTKAKTDLYGTDLCRMINVWSPKVTRCFLRRFPRNADPNDPSKIKFEMLNQSL
jgi:hypothetical protein